MARSYEEQTRIDLAATFRIIAHLGCTRRWPTTLARPSRRTAKVPAESEVETLFAHPRQRPAAAGRR
jgi:hypothetical protein